MCSRSSVSFEPERRQHSAASTLVLNRSISKRGFFKTLIASSTCDVKAVFSGTSGESAREISSIFARFGYLVSMLSKGENIVVNKFFALFWTIEAVGGGGSVETNCTCLVTRIEWKEFKGKRRGRKFCKGPINA